MPFKESQSKLAGREHLSGKKETAHPVYKLTRKVSEAQDIHHYSNNSAVAACWYRLLNGGRYGV